MRISLHPGVWVGSITLWIAGGVAVTQSPSPDQIQTYRIGEIAIALGLLLFVWGIKWDGRHWWNREWFNLGWFRPRRGLYVGNVIVSDADLNANHYLDVSFRGYNGTAQTVRYGGLTGTAQMQFANTPGGFELQPPIFMHGEGPIRPGEEFTLSFRLVFTPAQLGEFQSMQAAGVICQLMFGGLNIFMTRGFGQPLRLPLWDGASLQGTLVGGRIVCVTAHATIHPVPSLT
jgi:hypothetical protein